MHALRLTDSGLELQTVPEPEAGPGDVLVDVTLAGLCETDLQLAQGYMGFRGTLGHEFIGVARSGRYAGRRVTGEINCACGACDFCRQGVREHCPHRTVLGILGRDGAFAEVVRLPEENLHPIPESLTDETAVFVEPVAAACEILTQIGITRGERIVILGDGRLGTLCAQVLQAEGGDVTLVGKHPEKLELISDIGVRTALLSETRPDRSASVVVDCTGSPTGLPTAISFVRPRGTIVLKTTTADTPKVNLAPLVIDEITLLGSRCGPFGEAIAQLDSGAVQVEPLITDIVPLDEAPAAFEAPTRGAGFKTLFRIA